MAGKTNISDYRFSIFINNDQAKRSLVEMEKVMQGYEAELAQLVRENKKDSQEYRDKKKVYDDHLEQMKKVRQEAGLQALSIKELRSLRAQLNNEMARAVPGSEHRVRLQKEFDAVDNRVKELTVSAKNSGLSFGKMADGFNKYFAIFTAAAASITGLIFSFRKVVDVFNEYEKKLDNLSALTGLTGENLDWLSQKAKEMSTGMVEGGIRITQSADAIVDAYTKVGSARPELLKNKDDLNMVTQEAIILSEAANSELQPAVESLAGVLNQFNAPANDSRRIINALAAGSKEGAGEIPYLTEAIEKSGTVAADAGISYEELVGIIETLAPRITQPEIAGRSLRAVILKLQEGAKDTNPAIVGFTQAIENLGKKHLSVSALIKLFGIENITAGKILINNIGELKKYTAAVTNTNVALEQAATNTGNNSSKLDQARNRVQLYSIDLGEKLAPALTFSTNSFSYLMKAILASISFFNEHRAAVLSTLAAIAAYTIAINASSIATKAWTVLCWLANTALKTLNLTVKSSPWAWVAAGIVAAATYLLSYKKTVDETAKSQQRLNDIKKSFNDMMNDERAGLDLLIQQLKKTNIASTERQNLIDTINQRYGTTLQNIKDEKKFLDQLNGTYANLFTNMQKKALLESKEDTLKQLYKERQDVLNKIQQFDENIKKNSAAQGVEIEAPGDTPQAKKIREQMSGDKDKYFPQLTSGAKEFKTELDAIEQEINHITELSPQDLSIISATGPSPDKTKPDADTDSKDKYEGLESQSKEHKDYLLKIRKELEDATIQLIKDEKEKELKLNELDLKRKLEAIKGHSKDEEQLRELYQQEAKEKEEDINKKYSDKAIDEAIKVETEKWKAIIDADEKGSEQWLAHSLELLKKEEELKLSNLKLTEQEKTDIVATYEAKRRALLNDFSPIGTKQPKEETKTEQGGMLQRSGADKLGEFQLGEKRRILKLQRDLELENAQGSAEAQTQIWKDYYASQTAATVDFINSAAAVASQVVSALSGVNQAMSDYENAQLKKDENANNLKKENLKKRLDSGKITQKQYNEGIEKLDAELDAKKKELSIKQAKRQKALSLAQAIINTAQAITSALSAGPIIGIVLAALVGILGAVQIAYIASTPISEAATGRYKAFMKSRQAAKGRYQTVADSTDGIFNSIYQAASGRYEQISNEVSGRYDVLGNEDKKQYRGVPYVPQPESGIYSTPTLFAETGKEIILNPKHTENLIRFRPDLVSQIMSVPQRASGLYPDTNPTPGSSQQQKVIVEIDPDFMSAVLEFKETMRRPVRADISYDSMVDSMSMVQTIEADASR